MILDTYLEHIQSEETSVMTFHIDSPHRKKKPMKKYEYPSEVATDQNINKITHKRIMIDFDDTIHDYAAGWNGGVITGKPLPGAKEAIDALKEDYEIVIFTTRAAPPEIDKNKSPEEQIKRVGKWLDEHGIYYDKVTGEKLGALAYVDDRAVRFEGNWNYVLQKIREIQAYELQK